MVYLNKNDFDEATKFDEKAQEILGQTGGTYLPNRNPISRLRPEPAELLRAKSKNLRKP